MERSRENNDFDLSILRIILSLVIIVASIFTICIVIINVMNIKILDGITVKGDDVKLIINTDNVEEQDMFFINDDKGLRCKKPDGSFARDEWIEKNGELFYFDTSSYGKDGDLRLKGQIYTLDKGKLKKMVRDKSYAISYDPAYYSSVDSSAFLAYLDKEENEYGYHAIRYKMYGENEEGVLGTIADPQYSTPYMIKTCENLIYYLPVGKKAPYAGVLYRMRPGATVKEYIGTSVEGYILLNNDVVYYYDGSRIIKAKTWKELEVKEYEEIESEENIENGIGGNIEDLPLPDLPVNSDKIDNVNENRNNLPDGPIVRSAVEDLPTLIETTNKIRREKETVETKNQAPIALEDLPLPD